MPDARKSVAARRRRAGRSSPARMVRRGRRGGGRAGDHWLTGADVPRAAAMSSSVFGRWLMCAPPWRTVSNRRAVGVPTRFQQDGSAPPVARAAGESRRAPDAHALGRAHALTRGAGIAYCRGLMAPEADAPDVAAADGDDARLGRPARRRSARALHRGRRGRRGGVQGDRRRRRRVRHPAARARRAGPAGSAGCRRRRPRRPRASTPRR